MWQRETKCNNICRYLHNPCPWNSLLLSFQFYLKRWRNLVERTRTVLQTPKVNSTTIFSFPVPDPERCLLDVMSSSKFPKWKRDRSALKGEVPKIETSPRYAWDCQCERAVYVSTNSNFGKRAYRLLDVNPENTASLIWVWFVSRTAILHIFANEGDTIHPLM